MWWCFGKLIIPSLLSFIPLSIGKHFGCLCSRRRYRSLFKRSLGTQFNTKPCQKCWKKSFIQVRLKTKVMLKRESRTWKTHFILYIIIIFPWNYHFHSHLIINVIKCPNVINCQPFVSIPKNVSNVGILSWKSKLENQVWTEYLNH